MISQLFANIRCYFSASRFVWMTRPLLRLNMRGVPYYVRGKSYPAWFLITIPFLVLMVYMVRKVHKRFNVPVMALVLVVSEIMLAYWEHYAVMNGHWVYNEARILGPRVWGIPIEEPLIYYWAPQVMVVATMLFIHSKLRKRTGERYMLLRLIEVAALATPVVVWYVFRKWFNRNVLGDLIAGTMIGVFWEYCTDALWTYHMMVNVYNDIPLAVLVGWGVMFTLAVFASEKLFMWLFAAPKVRTHDVRIFITDVSAAFLVGLPIEKFGLLTGLWEYHYEILHWSPARDPIFKMPYEVLVGYALLMMIAPTFVRYWHATFEREIEK